MPTSHPNQLNEIVQIAELIQPASVLDIGIGNGKYGFLLREYLGLNRNRNKEQFIIDGIEGTREYITEIQELTYNTIYNLDLSGKINLPDKIYDLCLLIDVVEHFDREKGLEIINFFSSISKFLLIATPWDIGDPDIRHENPLEDHKYQWVKDDFRQFQYHCFVFNSNSLIAVIGENREKIQQVHKKMSHRFYSNVYNYIRRSLGIKRG